MAGAFDNIDLYDIYQKYCFYEMKGIAFGSAGEGASAEKFGLVEQAGSLAIMPVSWRRQT
jgi:hypothetical protein